MSRRGDCVRKAWAQKGHPCNDHFRKFGQRFETREHLARWNKVLDEISFPQMVKTPLLSVLEKEEIARRTGKTNFAFDKLIDDLLNG